ncbi:MAG: SMC-Scp complex subunit ScpB, partial [Christensenellaceae bacterium]|nr:SMC-Scp complex subunit ScpB [Christensenellaceae bacterium]
MSETISETDMIEINNELNLASAIEASLFLAGDGLDAKYFAEKFLKTEEEVKEAIAELKQKYSGESGIHLIKYKNNYQL